ncbi:MAG: ATP-binding cassette domain-containing protein, partial [Propionibacterium sp.]|nr:ATP-binding cassette domain-containing protein [Propionibacterium sp.]
MSSAAIDVRGLGKRFGALRAVTDVTFTASAGRVTGLLGPNGAGKTTTLRMLLGLVAPSEGEALIH